MVKPDYTPAEREVIKKGAYGRRKRQRQEVIPGRTGAGAGQSSGPDNGVAHSTINHIATGRLWSHLTGVSRREKD